ncbi:MAG: anti-sigma factor family protein [Acidimicrobiales bacterium]
MSGDPRGRGARAVPDDPASERLPTCREVVEIVTDYLDGTLAPDESQRLELHLVWCQACRTYLEQMRESIRLTGRLAEEEIPEEARGELMRLFRDWRR